MKFLLITAILCLTTTVSNAEVPRLYREVAEKHKVPPTLFYALILNESRSLTKAAGRRQTLPWPWTINHRGTPHFFPSEARAVEFAKHLVATGDTLFDVGLGQVNWYHHNHRFDSLESAFNPRTNLEVAAGFLREQYERSECSTWALAIGCYHRPGQREKDKRIAGNYAKRVITLWVDI